jgi:hypothetical protein
MSNNQTNTSKQWLLFVVSTVALVAAIYLKWPWLTLIIPFVCTSFVKAMRIM